MKFLIFNSVAVIKAPYIGVYLPGNIYFHGENWVKSDQKNDDNALPTLTEWGLQLGLISNKGILLIQTSASDRFIQRNYFFSPILENRL